MQDQSSLNTIWWRFVADQPWPKTGQPIRLRDLPDQILDSLYVLGPAAFAGSLAGLEPMVSLLLWPTGEFKLNEDGKSDDELLGKLSLREAESVADSHHAELGDLAPITEGTAEQFMEQYAHDSHVTVADLQRWGREPYYVSSCAEHDFPHWEMGRTTDNAFDRRHQIPWPGSFT